MQPKIKKISMRLINNNDDSEIKAFASVIFENSVKVNGIKIVKNSLGKLIVVLPEGKGIQYVVPTNEDARRLIDDAIIKHYFSVKKTIIETLQTKN